MALTTHSLSSAEVQERSRAIPLLSLRALAAYNRVNLIYEAGEVNAFSTAKRKICSDHYVHSASRVCDWQYDIGLI